MHRDVDAALQQRLFDLAGEQPLAADVLQRAVLDLVAHHLDHHDLERRLGQRERHPQTAPHLMRLPQGKRRATGSNLQRTGGGGEIITHAQGITLSIKPDNS